MRLISERSEMKRYNVKMELHVESEGTYLGKSSKDAAKRAMDRRTGWTVTSVDGIAVVGRCEACGDPVLEDEDYSVPDEMVCICESCRKGMSDDD